MPTEPVPAGVDAATKQGLLDLVDYAAGRGWPVSKTCEVLVSRVVSCFVVGA